MERGEAVVSRRLAASIETQAPRTPISSGMPLRRALDIVFLEQSRHMARTRASGDRLQARFGFVCLAPLNTNEARKLTIRIRAGMRQACLLLLEAHDRGAWKAMGYRSWDNYVHQEFGLSRSRSYELLD